MTIRHSYARSHQCISAVSRISTERYPNAGLRASNWEGRLWSSYRSENQGLHGFAPDPLVGLVVLDEGLLLAGQFVGLHLHLFGGALGWRRLLLG